MREKIKVARYLETSDKNKFYEFLKRNDLSIGIVADKLYVTYVYLTLVFNGKRAFTKKLEEKLAALGFKL
jgi:hypothetical protein